MHPESFGNAEKLDRPVLVDGALGREMSELSLYGFSEKGEKGSMSGNDAFNEIYIETESGNIYCLMDVLPDELLYPEKYAGIQGLGPAKRWHLADSRKSEGSGSAKGVFLTNEDLENGVLRVGEPFHYGHGGVTTRVTKITGVSGKRVVVQSAKLTPEELQKIAEERTQGNISDVRKKFLDSIKKKKS